MFWLEILARRNVIFRVTKGKAARNRTALVLDTWLFESRHNIQEDASVDKRQWQAKSQPPSFVLEAKPTEIRLGRQPSCAADRAADRAEDFFADDTAADRAAVCREYQSLLLGRDIGEWRPQATQEHDAASDGSMAILEHQRMLAGCSSEHREAFQRLPDETGGLVSEALTDICLERIELSELQSSFSSVQADLLRIREKTPLPILGRDSQHDSAVFLSCLDSLEYILNSLEYNMASLQSFLCHLASDQIDHSLPRRTLTSLRLELNDFLHESQRQIDAGVDAVCLWQLSSILRAWGTSLTRGIHACESSALHQIQRALKTETTLNALQNESCCVSPCKCECLIQQQAEEARLKQLLEDKDEEMQSLLSLLQEAEASLCTQLLGASPRSQSGPVPASHRHLSSEAEWDGMPPLPCTAPRKSEPMPHSQLRSRTGLQDSDPERTQARKGLWRAQPCFRDADRSARRASGTGLPRSCWDAVGPGPSVAAAANGRGSCCSAPGTRGSSNDSIRDAPSSGNGSVREASPILRSKDPSPLYRLGRAAGATLRVDWSVPLDAARSFDSYDQPCESSCAGIGTCSSSSIKGLAGMGQIDSEVTLSEPSTKLNGAEGLERCDQAAAGRVLFLLADVPPQGEEERRPTPAETKALFHSRKETEKDVLLPAKAENFVLGSEGVLIEAVTQGPTPIETGGNAFLDDAEVSALGNKQSQQTPWVTQELTSVKSSRGVCVQQGQQEQHLQGGMSRDNNTPCLETGGVWKAIGGVAPADGRGPRSTGLQRLLTSPLLPSASRFSKFENFAALMASRQSKIEKEIESGLYF